MIEANWGEYRRKSAGRCGTEPQMTPAAASTTLKYSISALQCISQKENAYAIPKVGGSFQVRSVFTDSGIRKYRPTELATIALDPLLVVDLLHQYIRAGGAMPYITPVKNTAIIPNLFLRDICSLNRTGRGRIKIYISDNRPKMPWIRPMTSAW